MRITPADLFQTNDTPSAAKPHDLDGSSDGAAFGQVFASASRQASVGGPSGREQRQARLEDPAGSVAERGEDETELDVPAEEQAVDASGQDVGSAAAATPAAASTDDQGKGHATTPGDGQAKASEGKNAQAPKMLLKPNVNLTPSTAQLVTEANEKGPVTASGSLPNGQVNTAAADAEGNVSEAPPKPVSVGPLPMKQDGGGLPSQKISLDPTRLTADTFNPSGDSTSTSTDPGKQGETPPHLKQDGQASSVVAPNHAATQTGAPVPPTLEPIVLPDTAAKTAEIKIESVVGAMQAAPATGHATVATGTEAVVAGESPLTDSQHLTDQIGRALRTVVQQRGGSMTIRLNPPEMGMVRIQVRLEGNVVQAQFEVTSEAVRTLLHQQMSQLKDALGQQGLSVDQLQVSQTGPSNASKDTEADVSDDGRSRGHRGEEASEAEEGANGSEDEGFEKELLDLMA